jgi:hypothetical protein
LFLFQGMYHRSCKVACEFFFPITGLEKPNDTMVIASAAAEVVQLHRPALSLTERESCAEVQRQCIVMLATLNSFRVAHSDAEGHPQSELCIADKYRRTLEHLDAVCDGLFDLINS